MNRANPIRKFYWVRSVILQAISLAKIYQIISNFFKIFPGDTWTLFSAVTKYIVIYNTLGYPIKKETIFSRIQNTPPCNSITTGTFPWISVHHYPCCSNRNARSRYDDNFYIPLLIFIFILNSSSSF